MKNEINYIRQLDGLRFFSIAGVMITHFIHFDNVILQRIPFGYGVNLFFVISGFLITTILLKLKADVSSGNSTFSNSIKTFYIRRTLRIFPIYYITLFFLYFTNFQNTRDIFLWPLTYTTNIYLSLDKPYIGSFNHLWSLAVEEQYYLFWPFLILLVPKRFILVLIYSTIALSVIFKIVLFSLAGYTTALNAFTLSCADALGLGSLIGYWFLYDHSKLALINKKKSFLFFASLLFILLMIFPRPSEYIPLVLGNTLFSIFAFFVVARAAEGKFKGWFASVLENRAVMHLGKISYGIYLFHFFMPDLYNYTSEHFKFIEGITWFKKIFLFLSSIIIAQLSWTIIEAPVVRLKKKINY